MTKSETSRGTKRERTRALLIENAAQLFEERGILATSLEQVATAAGMSKGAIYSNFDSKDDLVLAVVLAQDLMLKPRVEPEMSIVQVMEAVGTAVAALVTSADGKAKLIAEYMLYSASSETLRDQLTEAFSDRVARLAGQIDRSGLSAGMTARELVLACEALTTGFVVHRVVMQSDISDDEIVAAFVALATGEKNE